ncbi:hypothetical protein EZS27_023705 [termite gut metagenome]|uniref:DUF4249 domain-containing protein n=1 Tax=termite gut metagenome TaxID=433724 RepID=A0A5J4R212_9ZZZZ
MFKNLFFIIWIFFSVSFLLSCEEPYDIDTDDAPPVIVIYGSFTNEWMYHSIKVSVSSPYFDPQPNRGISGAEVWIKSSAGDVYGFIENDTVPGLYQTIDKVAGIPNLAYTLNVEVDFDNDNAKEIYTATSYMLTPTEIDSVKIQSLSMMGRKGYAMYLYAQDVSTEDYYLSRYKVNDTLVSDNLSQTSLMSDRTFNGQYMNAMLLHMFRDVDDRNEDKDADRDENRRAYLGLGDVVTLSFGRIEKGYYNFINQCRDEMEGESPFFGSPASNIITNISNGGRGYFACYPLTSIETTVKSKNEK